MHRCAVAYDSVSDLMAFGGVGSLCVLIFSMQPGYRPPGAIFFLLRRRKNMERKTPLRAGGPSASVRPLAFALQMPYLIERERGSKTAPFTLSLPGARSNCVRHRSRALYGVPGRLVTASVPCKLVCRPLAASLLLTHCGCDLMAFFQGWKPLRLNFFHAIGLAPSGGHILSSPAKKEYGKKDAA